MPSQLPKISIVTPNYNYGHFLEQTILSVIGQNYPNLEYIIIDGGSTDNSIDIIKKYERYISYWVSEPDKGMYDAINKGFQKSSGQIMAWINSDDVYFPWAFQTVGEIFSELRDVQWITTLQPGLMDFYGKILGFEKFKGFSQIAFKEGMYGSQKRSYGAIQQESTFWTKKLWEESGGYLSLEYAMASDYELWARFFLIEKLYGVISPLGCYRTQSQQKTNLGNRYAEECSHIMNRYNSSISLKATLRKFISSTRMSNLPLLGWRLARVVGFDATNINRFNSNTESSKWIKETSIFL